jgi:hypothetical protein
MLSKVNRLLYFRISGNWYLWLKSEGVSLQSIRYSMFTPVLKDSIICYYFLNIFFYYKKIIIKSSIFLKKSNLCTAVVETSDAVATWAVNAIGVTLAIELYAARLLAITFANDRDWWCPLASWHRQGSVFGTLIIGGCLGRLLCTLHYKVCRRLYTLSLQLLIS